MQVKKKIGLFGGSFNPIHKEHIKLIKKIISKNLIDELWIIPCKNHAFNKKLISAKHRINMIKLAISPLSNFKKRIKISKIELKSKGKNYTLKTLKKLQKKYPKFKFSIVVGSDILYEIHKWYNYKQLLNISEFIIFKRKGYEFININNLKILAKITSSLSNISSTKIRQNINKRKPFKNMVPLKIKQYIEKNNLYQ